MARAMNLALSGLRVCNLRHTLLAIGKPCRTFASSQQHADRDLTGVFENYPSKFDSTHTVAGLIQEFGGIEDGARCTDTILTVYGRITAKRDASNKLCFYDLTSDGATVQVMATKNHFAEADGASFKHVNAALHRGDIVGICGFPGKSNKGELSIFPHSITLLAPCSENLPLPGTLTDPEIRHRQRYLDLLSNSTSWRGGAPPAAAADAPDSRSGTASKTVGSKQWRSSWLPSAPSSAGGTSAARAAPQRARGARDVLLMRSRIISNIRRFFEDDGFMEVETPVLFPSAGGATAKSFRTHMDAYSTDMHLRIAPELFLKQLVVGGFERVFEIGKVFRNEGVSPVHHPEFTTVESYQAYTDVRGVMDMTQRLLQRVCNAALGSSSTPLRESFMTEAARAHVESTGGTPEGGLLVDFEGPYAELHIPTELAQVLGKPLPDSRSDGAAGELLQLCQEHGVPVSPPYTTARLLDSMIGHWLEPRCIQPTFITGHPVALSPLAKQEHPSSDITERFELFVGGREIANAYSELNDPAEQARRFDAQSAAREEGGDEEAHGKDDDFVMALRHGLPPTGGFGLGIDRFVMLLTGAEHLRDVLAFPINRPKEQ